MMREVNEQNFGALLRTARSMYDYILIDCPPSLGIMSLNAIAAATDGILIPTNMDLMSTRGVENLIEKIA